MIRVIVNNQVFRDFTEVTATRALSTLANDFSFTASAINGYPPFKLGDSVQIEVDGQIQVSGKIESENGNESEGSHQVTYSGRDKTADFIDSSFFEYDDINGDITLKELIALSIKNIRLNISVIDNVNPDPFNPAEDDIKPVDGTNCLQFCRDYARKRQCILTSNENGDIVIDRTAARTTNNRLIRKNGVDGNILSQSWSRNSSDRFYRYIHVGQRSPVALNRSGSYNNETIVKNWGRAVDNGIPISRQNVIIENDSYSNEQLERRAEWELIRQQAKGLRFNCTVKDHSDQDGLPWQENTLCLVDSEPAGVSKRMLIDRVSFVYADGAQTATQLSFVEEGAYDV